MPLDVLAQAELATDWSAIAPRLEAAVGAVPGARWVTWSSEPGEPEARAAVALDPADPVALTFRDGVLSARARSGPWGPGYHRRVVAVLDALGEALGGGWGTLVDPAGYAQDRDVTALEQGFLRRALSLWDLERSPLLLEGARVGLVLGEGPARVPVGRIATPLGYRDATWAAEVCHGLRGALMQPSEALPPEARRAFLWWSDPPDAVDWVQLGRAICASEVIWRDVSLEGDPEQAAARARALACFAEARRLDPTASLPEPERARLEALVAGPGTTGPVPPELVAAGYREGWVLHPVAGRWNLEVPGWYHTGCGADGQDVLWSEGLTLHASAVVARSSRFSAAAEADAHLTELGPAVRQDASVELTDDGVVRGYQVTLPRNGRGTLLQGLWAAGRERLLLTAVLRQPEAEAVLRRLRRSVRPLRLPGGSPSERPSRQESGSGGHRLPSLG